MTTGVPTVGDIREVAEAFYMKCHAENVKNETFCWPIEFGLTTSCGVRIEVPWNAPSEMPNGEELVRLFHEHFNACTLCQELTR